MATLLRGQVTDSVETFKQIVLTLIPFLRNKFSESRIFQQILTF